MTFGYSYREELRRPTLSQLGPLRSCKKKHFKLPAEMILQYALLIDQISVPVLGGFVVSLVVVECLKKCTTMVKVGLSRFQMPIGVLASVYHR